LNHHQYSSKSDVWSWGITCVEILLQDDPYPNMDRSSVATLVSQHQLTPEIPSNAPKEIEILLKQCFEYNPDDRPDFEDVYGSLIALKNK